MGTNYYLNRVKHEGACAHCAEETDRVHLGKSSIGWKFCFAADPEWKREDALTLWLRQLDDGFLEDEYGDPIEQAELFTLIMHKQGGRSHTVDHGVDITGPHFDMFSSHQFDCKGFDFTDTVFS